MLQRQCGELQGVDCSRKCKGKAISSIRLGPRRLCSNSTARPIKGPISQPPSPKKDLKSSKVAIFVEPSPFSHVSGMKNRFESLIKGLTQAGDEVMVFTPDQDPPSQFCGAKVRRRGDLASHPSAVPVVALSQLLLVLASVLLLAAFLQIG